MINFLWIKIPKLKEIEETKIIEYDQYFPAKVEISSEIIPRIIIESSNKKYIELTNPEYQNETFNIPETIQNIKVSKFRAVYINKLNKRANTETIITQQGRLKIK